MLRKSFFANKIQKKHTHFGTKFECVLKFRGLSGGTLEVQSREALVSGLQACMGVRPFVHMLHFCNAFYSQEACQQETQDDGLSLCICEHGLPTCLIGLILSNAVLERLAVTYA